MPLLLSRLRQLPGRRCRRQWHDRDRREDHHWIADHRLPDRGAAGPVGPARPGDGPASAAGTRPPDRPGTHQGVELQCPSPRHCVTLAALDGAVGSGAAVVRPCGGRAVLPAAKLSRRALRRRRHRLLRRVHRLHEPDQHPRRRRQRRQAGLGRVRDPVRGRARRRVLRAPEDPARTSRPGIRSASASPTR